MMADHLVADADLDLQVFCGTWNMGNQEPKLDVSEFFCEARGCDLVVIG